MNKSKTLQLCSTSPRPIPRSPRPAQVSRPEITSESLCMCSEGMRRLTLLFDRAAALLRRQWPALEKARKKVGLDWAQIYKDKGWAKWTRPLENVQRFTTRGKSPADELADVPGC